MHEPEQVDASADFRGACNTGTPERAAMRIAYIFMRFPMAVQPFAISDVLALEANGHHVDAYALSGWDKHHAELVEAYGLRLPRRSHWSWRTAVALARPDNWPILGRLLSILWRHRGGEVVPMLKALALAPRLIEVVAELKRNPVDVVHAFWGHYPSLALTLAQTFAPQCHRSIFLGAYDLTSHLIPYSRPALEACQTVTTHSEENRDTLLAFGVRPEQIAVIRRGIPLDLADGPRPERESLRICTAANLQKEKNMDIVLRVFRQVRETHGEARLMIAGDGEERAALEKLAGELGIAEHVDFPGHLSREGLFQEMARSRVFLFLSTKVSERLPNVVKEAMLAGCHCIVSETPGIRELIEPGATGEIVPHLDPAAVAGTVNAALATQDDRIGAAASRFVRETMSSEAAMRRHTEVWRRELHG